MVSNLDLGFWVNLFNHDNLWKEGLRKEFPHKDLPRGEAYDRLKKLNTLRNRIAHHEPIFHRNLQRDRADILETLGWICPTTKAWVKDHERMHDVIKMRPKQVIKICNSNPALRLHALAHRRKSVGGSIVENWGARGKTKRRRGIIHFPMRIL